MSESTDLNDLSERAQYLLKVLVERYIISGQPLGSRTLARLARLELSPATVRNVMADLEDIGLVRSPHTSAGRIPTSRGFRLFVDSLLTVKDLTNEEVQRIWSDLEFDGDIKELVQKTSTMLSEATRLVGVVMVPRSDLQTLRHVEFLSLSANRVLTILVLQNNEVQNRIIHTERRYSRVELEKAANYLNGAFVGLDLRKARENLLKEMSATRREMDRIMQAVIEMAEKAFVPHETRDDYVLAGQTNLMEVNELSNIDKLRKLFEAFNHKRDVLHLLDQAINAEGVQIFIGEESGYDAFDECSFVTSTYQADGQVLGVLGIIGPTRMSYERVIPIVDITAKVLGAALKSLH
jgi:heat-inducible transcriptional repressor